MASVDAPGVVAPETVPIVLRATGLSVDYGKVRAVTGVDLTVHEGGMVLLLGPNGAGKTSFVSALAGAVRPSGGSVLLDGKEVGRLPAYRRVRRGISLVPEGRGTLRGLSVAENLVLGWRAAPASMRRPLRESIDEVAERFPWMSERMHQDCSTLSGGEMQMLAIGRALLARPKVLLLDEPSLGLAPQIVATVYRLLSELNRGGLAMVVVEQKAVPLEVAPEATMVLQRGRVIWSLAGRRPSEEELASLYLHNEVPV